MGVVMCARGVASRGRGQWGFPPTPKMAAPEVPEALAGGFCNRPRHRPDLPPPLPSFVFV